MNTKAFDQIDVMKNVEPSAVEGSGAAGWGVWGGHAGMLFGCAGGVIEAVFD